ncbi:2',3'-cyclic-nucleotide 2'-phosphodiesterase [Lachnospiraceae bacterium KM106-2]|nr:2',3'-cyclic-nucleotide 2'-phosphodiesterase [Lachnospiraceae bacterium KM106-2]
MEQKLKIYFTSDVHGYFFSTNYASREEQNRGLLKCASQFEKDENTLIIDAGDILQGSAYTYYCQSELKSNASIAAIMNQCGYDYVTLGNHDFNYGIDYQDSYIEALNGTCVCQNVKNADGSTRYPYQIKTLGNGLKVGIVGIVTDYVNVWEKPANIAAVSIVDPFVEAKMALEEMKDQVDVTICVYHGGFERDLATGKLLSETKENVAYQICEELSFDLLLTGHQHMSIPGQLVNGTYVVQPKENATEYHKIEVVANDGGLEITSMIKRPDDASKCETSEELLAIEADVQDWLDNVVGELEKPLLPEDKVTMAVNGNAIADFINQIQLHYSKAQISAVSLANEIAGFNKKVTRRDIITTYPYPNTLVVYEISGKDLRAAIERSAEYVDVDENDKMVISKSFLEPKVEHYNYDYYAGVSYQIDPSKEQGKRIISCTFEGKEINDADMFSICINNYRASGAGDYPMYPKCKVINEINIEMVDMIMNYFEEMKNEVIQVMSSEKIMVLQS